MSAGELPAWAAWVVAALAIGGAAFSLVGAIGLVRLASFYERVHAPTLGATLGVVLVLAAALVHFAATGRSAAQAIVIAAFILVTTPVALVLLARAAAYRQRTEGDPDAPPEP